VVTFAKRFAAVAAVLTLAVGNLAICAGWQATPQARMECCKNGTSCPMHKSGSHRSGSTRVISQAEADNCCAAASTRTQASGASSSFALSNTSVLPALPALVFQVPVLALQEWRALIPLPVSPIPKHLLLSVLLV